MRKITEVRNDHTDEEDNYTYIDAYFDADDNSEDKSIAAVCQDTGKVLFFDNAYRNDPMVIEAIKEATPEILVEDKSDVIYSLVIRFEDIVHNNKKLKAHYESLSKEKQRLFADFHSRGAKSGCDWGIGSAYPEVMNTIASDIINDLKL